MVPPDSDRVSPAPPYSGYCSEDSLTTTRLSLSSAPLSNGLRLRLSFLNAVLQPRSCRNNYGLGYSPFARHYLGNHYCFLLLRVLRCFSSPRSPILTDIYRVAPFGNLAINGCLRLLQAYRSLPRPSSPSSAKSSTNGS